MVIINKEQLLVAATEIAKNYAGSGNATPDETAHVIKACYDAMAEIYEKIESSKK